MILLLDAGNTRIKWRLGDGAHIREGAFAHEELDGLAATIASAPGLTRVLGTNVAGEAVAEAIAEATRAVGLAPEWLRSSTTRCGVRNLYLDPAQLGADRWAALIGARAHHRAACLVVMAGTATTVDVLDAEGNFRGGLILPGVDLMQRALAANTAQLRLAHGCFSTLPRNTADAILSGCLQAQAGAVERMFRQVEGMPGAHCLLAGGAADALAPLLGVPLQRFDNLVLDGLAAVAEEQ